MLSASGHKFHGPKGIGFLYMSNRVKIGPLIHGGSQERSRRAGTHNVPGIVGMAKAAELAHANMDQTIAKRNGTERSPDRETGKGDSLLPSQW